MVEAAGGVLYRWQTLAPGIMKFSDHHRLPPDASGHAALDNLEVCVVHRPKYDDWSWPKGKLEANESHRHAAVREICEETGTPVALGPILGDITYPLSAEGKNTKRSKGKSSDAKHVVYWMAKPITLPNARHRASAFGPVLPADHMEIDQVRWVNVQRARRLLSHQLDREILDLFVDRVEEGAAAVQTLIIVRHAKAEPRKLWQGSDADRPITPRGASAAYALNREFACYNPTSLVSSPWTRCMETLELFSWQTGYAIATAPEVTESAFAADPDASWQRLSDQISDALTQQRCTLLCMHRPVIGGVFPKLRAMCASKFLASQLIAKSPYMPSGSAIALMVIDTPSGPSIIDIQRIAPIVY